MTGTMITYEFWRKASDGDVCAVKLEDGLVVGVCGPLDAEEIDDEFLESFDYATDTAARIERERDEYTLYEPALPYGGG